MPPKQKEAVDVHSWLLEPGDDSCGLGIVGSFYGAVFDLFSKLVKLVSDTPRYASSDIARRYRHELRRLYLWGDGFSVEEGHLDEILIKASELRHSVLSLLFQLSEVLSSEFHHVVALVRKSQGRGLREDMADLRRMQEQVGLILQDSSLHQPISDVLDSDSASDSPFSETGQETLDDISTYIDCLMDLNQAVEHPAIDFFDDPDEDSQQEAEVFDVSTPQALTYCRRIRDRFPHLPRFLVERLGELNAERAIRISSAEAEQSQGPRQVTIADKAEGDQENRTITDPPTESLFSSTNLRLTDTTKSTMQTESSLSASRYSSSGVKGHLLLLNSRISSRGKNPDAKPPLPLDLDDTASVATFASYRTTASVLGEGRPRIPPLPESAETGGTFDCPACWRELRGPMTRLQWKKHIFDDLVPYCCIHEECQDCSQTFQRTKPWAMHLQLHMGSSAWPISNCPFCGPESKRLDYETFLKHVSSHFREVSLAALPIASQGNDEGQNISDGISSLCSSVSERSAEVDKAPVGSNTADEAIGDVDKQQVLTTDVLKNPLRDLNIEIESFHNSTAEQLGVIPEFPCELYLYSRCDFFSTSRESWKAHVLWHFQGRIPWKGPWNCWFCDEVFDQVVDSNYDESFEPLYLNIPAFHQRLDHIADHFTVDNYKVKDARRYLGLIHWLGPKPQASLTPTRQPLCLKCGSTLNPQMLGRQCHVCRASSRYLVALHQYSDQIPEGSRCSTEPFGGPQCDHEWKRFRGGCYCLSCGVAIDPKAWEHAWLNARGQTACCYCGIEYHLGAK